MKNRQVHFDLLRCCACFAVIVIHVSASRQYDIPVNSTDWQIFNIYNSLARFSVPTFIMISGAFLLSPEKNVTLQSVYTKRVPKLIIVLLTWELFYAIVDFIWRGEAWSSTAPLTILQTMLKGHYHLWYLQTLLALYLLTPALRIIAAKQNVRINTICVLFLVVFCALKPLRYLFWLPKPVDDLVNIPGYAGHYLLGYFLTALPRKRRCVTALYILGVLGAISVIVVQSAISSRADSTSGVVYDFLSLPVLAMSAAVFLFFKEKVSKIQYGAKTVKFISSASACSFGIYLLHAFIIERFGNMGVTSLSFNPALAVPLLALLVFAVTWGIIWILRKNRFIKRYLT